MRSCALHLNLLLWLAACGSNDDSLFAPLTDSGAGGSTSDGSAGAPNSDAPADGNDRCSDAMPPSDAAACNSLEQDAPLVDVIDVAANPPPSNGGPITAGVYWKTASVMYTGPGGHEGPTGMQERTKLRLFCGVFDMVLGTATDTRLSGSFSSSSTGRCELAVTCGGAASSPISGYDATATTIVFYNYQAPAFAVTYTLRGGPSR